MRIGKREVGPGNPAYIIFEVASTHGNDWETAAAYVSQAAEAGADAVKFQLFETDKLLAPITKGFKGTYEYFKKSETPREWFPKMKALCDEKGIDLLCTPFDTDAADFLNSVGVPAMKVASGDLTYATLLQQVARFKRPVILSTGMATLAEVEQAVNALRENGAEDIALMQCVSVYPTSFEDANVSAMQTLREKFGTVVGYSDNGSKGMLVPLLAVALGASIIEKHVTSKKERGDIDDVFSMSVEEFGEMVRRVRELEKMDTNDALALLRTEYGADVDTALGDGIKRPAPYGTEITHPGVKGKFIQREADERHWARRGVYLNRPVTKGGVITEDMLIFLRPDVGISATAYEQLVGKTAGEDLPARLPLKFIDDAVLRFHPEDAGAMYAEVDDKEFVESLIRQAIFV